ncbi:hypothetical protein WJX72_005122 [[Myrmecia] bisecta]|uniref:Uncharacterized protein n=1 Tax=[Myrmecia] bisecta TaxID=41462 RepID=A0AAW1PPU0_9CHLO
MLGQALTSDQRLLLLQGSLDTTRPIALQAGQVSSLENILAEALKPYQAQISNPEELVVKQADALRRAGVGCPSKVEHGFHEWFQNCVELDPAAKEPLKDVYASYHTYASTVLKRVPAGKMKFGAYLGELVEAYRAQGAITTDRDKYGVRYSGMRLKAQ